MDNEQEKKEMPDEEIIDKKTEKKQNKSFFIAIVVIISALVILFSLRILLGEEKYPEYTYNGFTFVKIAGLWNTDWQRDDIIYKIHLRFGPKEAEVVPLLVSEEFDFNTSRTTYITFDPLGEDFAHVAIASTELSLTLYRVFDTKVIAACLRNETSACSSRPIITCDNTLEKETAVIYVKEDDETAIILDGNCLIIQGRGEEIIKAADKLIYGLYGIIE
tara:strand:+ start:4426 stop:5082 length:657 start_codon:yes stop_codon:yes gene_type:complete